MTNITAAMVKELRETTSAGMLDCKKALTETNGDMEQAIDWLRKKGLASAKNPAVSLPKAWLPLRLTETRARLSK